MTDSITLLGAALRSFVESEWTDDQDAKRAAAEACHAHSGRISSWRQDSGVDESTYFAFQEFEREQLKAEAVRFLQENGVTAEWRD